MKKAAVLSLLPVLFALSAVTAKADTITFDNDAPGIRANGFRSVDSNLVRFSTSPSPNHPGGELFINNFGPQISTSRALAARGETTSAQNIPIAIILDFDVPVSALSLDYGNDAPGGNAILTLYRNGVVVGQVVQPTNGNTAIDQTISFSFAGPGEYFDRATFAFDFGNPEIIDNVVFTQATGVATPTPTATPPPTPTPPTTTPVPEPATLLLLGSGLAGLALRRRRRKGRPGGQGKP